MSSIGSSPEIRGALAALGYPGMDPEPVRVVVAPSATAPTVTGPVALGATSPPVASCASAGSPVAPGATGIGRIPDAIPNFEHPSWWPLLHFGATHHRKIGALITGPSGSSKSCSILQMAHERRQRIITLQCAKGMTVDNLLGTIGLSDGNTEYKVPGPLVQALREDCWFVAEEGNMIPPGCWGISYNLLDGSGNPLILPDGSVLQRGPNFRLFFLCNEGYGGTQPINEALRDRLLPIYADYMPAHSEIQLLTTRCECDPDSAEALVGLATAVRQGRQRHGFDLSPRALMTTLDLMRAPPVGVELPWSEAIEAGILAMLDPMEKAAERAVVRGLVETSGILAKTLPVFTAGGAL